MRLPLIAPVDLTPERSRFTRRCATVSLNGLNVPVPERD